MSTPTPSQRSAPRSTLIPRVDSAIAVRDRQYSTSLSSETFPPLLPVIRMDCYPTDAEFKPRSRASWNGTTSTNVSRHGSGAFFPFSSMTSITAHLFHSPGQSRMANAWHRANSTSIDAHTTSAIRPASALCMSWIRTMLQSLPSSWSGLGLSAVNRLQRAPGEYVNIGVSLSLL